MVCVGHSCGGESKVESISHQLGTRIESCCKWNKQAKDVDQIVAAHAVTCCSISFVKEGPGTKGINLLRLKIRPAGPLLLESTSQSHLACSADIVKT